MYLIKQIKDINERRHDIYVIGEKMFLEKPNQFIEDDFEKIFFGDEVYVSSGWIDCHVHCDETNLLYGAKPDEIGYLTGVTTVIDAGSVGIDNLEQLYLASKKAITNVKCLLNISRLGIFKQSELADLKMVDFDYDQEKYQGFVVGFKTRMSKSVTITTGVEGLKIFMNKRKKDHLPLMVHIGNEPPEFEKVVDLLQESDIITHTFNYKNHSLFDKDGSSTSAVKLAQEKGILFDVGHGSESYNEGCASRAIKKGFKIDLISSDLYRINASNGVVTSLGDVMSKLKYNGLSWEEIILKVTKEPARVFNLKNEGELKDGFVANLTFFKIMKEKKKVIDSTKHEFELDEYLKPVVCFVRGKKYSLDNDIKK